jgi:predicted DNA-binding mobile mystery protein A
MENSQQNLVITQVDQRLSKLNKPDQSIIPDYGWVYTIRTALKMSLKQFGKRLGVSKQAAQKIEDREIEGSITLKALKVAANALQMELVYYLVPKEKSLQQIIEQRAYEKAKEIVLRTSHTMKLEEQENSKERIQTAIKEKAEELKKEMPKYIWD